MLTFAQAIVLGILQGVTELFPVSSLGHSVILPQLLGWTDVVAAQSATESCFLAFLVGLHVATALALLVFYRRRGCGSCAGCSPRCGHAGSRRPTSAWAGCWSWPRSRLDRRAAPRARAAGRVRPAARGCGVPGPQRPDPAVRRVGPPAGRGPARGGRARDRPRRAIGGSTPSSSARRAPSAWRRSFALLPGISRSGITMVAGLARGLDHEDAARFSFLLATPIILAAGVYKLPDLLGPNGDGVRTADPRREHRGVRRRLGLGPLPDPLVHDPDAAALRDLLARRRHPGGHPLRVEPRPGDGVGGAGRKVHALSGWKSALSAEVVERRERDMRGARITRGANHAARVGCQPCGDRVVPAGRTRGIEPYPPP